jgi:ferredoxin
LVLLFTGIALATSTTISASSDVIIYAFNQKPAGSDEGNEWVTFHNPTNKSVDIGNWTFESIHGTTAIDLIAEGTTLYPGAYCTYTPHYGWLDNSEESIILRNAKGKNEKCIKCGLCYSICPCTLSDWNHPMLSLSYN